MKKIALILAALLALSIFTSCKDDKKTVGAADSQTEAALPKLKAAGEVSLASLAGVLEESGLLGTDTSYFSKGDEYAEDVLVYTYDLEMYEAFGIKNYFVAEHGANEAYSCAVLLFDGEVETNTVNEMFSVLETYATDLKTSVMPYNPDAAKLCEKYVLRRLLIEGENGVLSAVCIFISDDNAALETLVTEKLTEICSGN